MFKSNSAREITYIFLWLIGIITFYALIHVYVLEPNVTHSSREESHLATTYKNVIEDGAKHTTQNIDTFDTDVHKASIEVPMLKPIKHVVKYKEQKTVAIKEITPVFVKKESIQDTKEEKLDIPNIKQDSKIESISIAIPSLPTAPKAVSVPTTPSVPKVIGTTFVPKQSFEHKKTKELDVQIQNFINALNRSEKIELLESARKLVNP